MAEPEAAGRHLVTISGTNPFPGLRAFDPAEHYLYFGRAEQTTELMSRLRSTRFLSVVGTSGSGKSSLVRAGLVPALHSGFMTSAGSSWRVAIMRPGGDPMGNLAEALASPEVLGEEGEDKEIARSLLEAALRGSSRGLAQSVEVAPIPEHDNVLLVVDQFEELFRFKKSTKSGASREAAVAFVKLLLEAVERPGRLYVVITMRSDFIGDCMEFPGLPEAINEGQYLVPRMTRDELRQAITGPVGVAGGAISPRLVSRLLNEVGDQHDQLPVMQHALMRMWGHWEETGKRDKIDLEDYKAIGTMKNALSLHAEKAFQELAEGREREIAERVFKTLTEMEGEGRGIRRPARLKELCDIAEATEEQVLSVIGHFRIPGRSFLTPPIFKAVTADSVIDISHESLMRNWERLARWTEEEAASARLYRRLSEAAGHHEAGEGGLWRSPELELGLSWRETNEPTPAWSRRYDEKFERAIAFLEKSKAARDEYQARRERGERLRRRRKKMLAASVGAVTLIVGILWYVWQEAKFLGAVSKALTVNDPQLRAQVLGEMPEPLLRRIGWLLRTDEPSPGGLELAALRAAAMDLIPIASLAGGGGPSGGGPLTSIAVSADGKRVLTGASDGTARIWPADGRGKAVDLKGHTGEISGASFHPTGGEVVTASADGTARLWETETGRELQVLRHRGKATGASFSSDGRKLVTAGGRSARIWERDGDAGEWVSKAELGHASMVSGVSFDRSGTRVLTFSEDRTARIWSAEGEELRALGGDGGGHAGPITAAAFSPDSAWAVTSSMDGTARLWRVEGSEAPIVLGEGKLPVLHVAFSPDGKQLATAGLDKRVRLWDLGEVERAPPGAPPPAEKAVLAGHTGPVRQVVFTADSRYLISTSHDHTARMWSRSGEMLRILYGHKDWVLGAATSGLVASQVLATAGKDGLALVWPLEPGEPWRIPRHREKVTSLVLRSEWSGEELELASASGKDARILRLVRSSGSWEPDSPRNLRGHTNTVHAVSFEPDGSAVATASEDGTIRVWSVEDKKKDPQVLKGHRGGVTSVSFSPGGRKMLVSSGKGKTTRLWRLDGAEWSFVREVGSFEGPVTSASFSPDGSQIVTTSGYRVQLWSSSEASDEPAGTSLTQGEDSAHRGAKVFSASFGPDGWIVTASADNTARVWKREGSGWSSISLVGHEDDVKSASFSAGGKSVVTASKDGTARVWRSSDGKELYRLVAGVEVEAAAFSADGSYVVTGQSDGSLLLWRVSEKRLHQYLKDASSACLSVEQRCRLLGEFEWQARRGFRKCEMLAGRPEPRDPGSCG